MGMPKPHHYPLGTAHREYNLHQHTCRCGRGIIQWRSGRMMRTWRPWKTCADCTVLAFAWLASLPAQAREQ